jgi:hypothetical protein
VRADPARHEEFLARSRRNDMARYGRARLGQLKKVIDDRSDD